MFHNGPLKKGGFSNEESSLLLSELKERHHGSNSVVTYTVPLCGLTIVCLCMKVFTMLAHGSPRATGKYIQTCRPRHKQNEFQE